MDEDLVYVLCGGCHARFKNASLVAAHQAKRVLVEVGQTGVAIATEDHSTQVDILDGPL